MTTTLYITSLFIIPMVITNGMWYCINKMRINHIPFGR